MKQGKELILVPSVTQLPTHKIYLHIYHFSILGDRELYYLEKAFVRKLREEKVKGKERKKGER